VSIRCWVALRGPQAGAQPVVIYDGGNSPVPLADEFPTPPGLGSDPWAWGSTCPGATRLAWVILAAHFGEDIAGCLAHDFARDVLAKASRRGFILGRSRIERWLTGWVVLHCHEFRRVPGKGGNGVIPY